MERDRATEYGLRSLGDCVGLAIEGANGLDLAAYLKAAQHRYGVGRYGKLPERLFFSQIGTNDYTSQALRGHCEFRVKFQVDDSAAFTAFVLTYS